MEVEVAAMAIIMRVNRRIANLRKNGVSLALIVQDLRHESLAELGLHGNPPQIESIWRFGGDLDKMQTG
jgi:hypothetical protein